MCDSDGVLWGRHRQTRRGGRGVEKGGDACVVLGGRVNAHGTRTGATQASPLHTTATPAPTETKPLLKPVGTFRDDSCCSQHVLCAFTNILNWLDMNESMEAACIHGQAKREQVF